MNADVTPMNADEIGMNVNSKFSERSISDWFVLSINRLHS